jgi:uncharacterized protein YqeY
MTLEEFKKAKIGAMKERNAQAVTAYNAIISKLMLLTIENKANGTDLTDENVLSCVKKVEKELVEEMEGYLKGGREETANEIKAQLEVVRKYIPQMMSAEQIKEEILKLDDKSVPNVMRHFKTNFSGKAELKTVSEVLKTL